MKKLMIISIFSSLLIINFSCSDSSTNPQPEPNTAVFPNTIGDTWVYAVYDSLNSTEDTLTVKVSSIVTALNSRNLMVWIYRANSGMNSNYTINNLDTAYVYSGNDTVYFYNNNAGSQFESKMVFPLQVGLQWGNAATGIVDTSQVVDQNSITVPAGTFQKTYHILRTKNGLNDYMTVNLWFTERVGIIKLFVTERGFAFRTFTWDLINYSVH